MRAGVLLPLCALLAVGACRPAPPAGPRPLIPAAGSGRLGSLTLEGDTRPALLASGAFRVPLPRRALLTFGVGIDWAGPGEAPGWLRVAVRAGGRTVWQRTLNPRALTAWRDASVELEGGGEAELHFDLRLTDRHGADIPPVPGLLLGIGDPVVHDLDAYGRAKTVVLVSIDTLRRDHVGAYGYAKPTTPRLDALAREGLVLEDAVSVSSWTLPSHLTMLTGVDPARHGGTHMKRGFNRQVPTVPALLRGTGFATRAVTSHLYVSPVYGVDEGFDRLDFHQDRRATDVANRAIDLIDRFGDRPLFLFLHLYDPHWHYDPPEEFRNLFAGAYAGTITGLWKDFSTRTRATVSDADLAHILALYDGEIRYADTEVGRVLDHLAARRMADNTLVVVTSDHGEEFLEHGSWEHQKTLYEEVVRIPLIVRGPGAAARRERTPASLLDVAPTILEWAGVAIPPSVQGRSLLRGAAGAEAYGETEHTTDGTHKVFLRAGADRWKAILSLDPSAGTVRREEWYDLASDPGERRSAPPAAAAADPIRARAVARWRVGRGAGAPERAVCLTPEQAERLKALGYVAGGTEGPCPSPP
jgi:arylsulfatase A-like enzyme